MSRERSSDQLPDEPSLSALYRSTRQEQPSAELDQAVMQEARRALSRRRIRWWLPLSTAAVILLGVSLTLNQMEPPGYSELSVEPQKESPPPATAPVPAGQGVREKLMKSAPAPSLQRAAPARKRAEADGFMYDAPMQMEMEEAPAAEAESAKRIASPEVQVAQMLELLRLGETQALGESLREFRAIYPDYVLPQELAGFEASLR